MSSERAWWTCALAGMRMGMGRAATMLEVRAEAATKMVENCILIVEMVIVVYGWRQRVAVLVKRSVAVVVKSVSWKLKGVL